MPNLSNFKNLASRVNKQRNNNGYDKPESKLTRKDRKVVMINKKYYFIIRKLVFEHPGTTIAGWCDRALQYACDHGILSKK